MSDYTARIIDDRWPKPVAGHMRPVTPSEERIKELAERAKNGDPLFDGRPVWADIEKLACSNPFVAAWYRMMRCGDCSEREALIGMVKSLADLANKQHAMLMEYMTKTASPIRTR